MTRRGTTNRNVRGNTRDRRSRRRWLVETFRADVDYSKRFFEHFSVPLGDGIPTCRCYRCGTLLTEATVTIDRVIPSCDGGTYARNNIRPACGYCNSYVGRTTRRTA